MTDHHLNDLRELFQAQLRRVEDVLTLKITLLNDELRRAEARIKHLEEHRP